MDAALRLASVQTVRLPWVTRAPRGSRGSSGQRADRGALKEAACSFEVPIRSGRHRGVRSLLKEAHHELAHQCTWVCKPHSCSPLVHEEIATALESLEVARQEWI